MKVNPYPGQIMMKIDSVVADEYKSAVWGFTRLIW